MSTEEKLQEIFQAALRSEDTTTFTPAGPPKAFVPSFTPVGEPSAAMPPDSTPSVESVPAPAADAAPNAGLDEKSSAELRELVDEQQARIRRKDFKNRIVGLAASIALLGGSTAWFVSDTERVAALNGAVSDIRSFGDVKSILSKYQAALDRIAVRGNQIEEATSSIGGSNEVESGGDPSTKDSKAFTGSEPMPVASNLKVFVR